MRIPSFQLERYFAKHMPLAPFFLGSSDCQSTTVGDLLTLEAGSAEKMQDLWLGYTDPLGNVTLRDELSKLYDTIGAGDVN